MGLINITDETDGTSADANDLNSRFAIVSGVINGNLDSANLKAGGVATSNIATGAITTAKVANGAITPALWTNPYKFYAYRNPSVQTIAPGLQKVQLNTISYDTNSNFDTTNNVYTVPVTGFYRFSWNMAVTVGTGDFYASYIGINGPGSQYPGVGLVTYYAFNHFFPGAVTIPLNAGDTVALYFQNGSGVNHDLQPGAGASHLCGELVTLT